MVEVATPHHPVLFNAAFDDRRPIERSAPRYLASQVIDDGVGHDWSERQGGAGHRGISEGLRNESDKVRCTCVYPGVVESELAESISDEVARERMKTYRKLAIPPDEIGRAIRYAIEQPADVDVNDIVVRPLGTLV